jgi:hypothetical protein
MELDSFVFVGLQNQAGGLMGIGGTAQDKETDARRDLISATAPAESCEGLKKEENFVFSMLISQTEIRKTRDRRNASLLTGYGAWGSRLEAAIAMVAGLSKSLDAAMESCTAVEQAGLARGIEEDMAGGEDFFLQGALGAARFAASTLPPTSIVGGDDAQTEEMGEPETEEEALRLARCEVEGAGLIKVKDTDRTSTISPMAP